MDLGLFALFGRKGKFFEITCVKKKWSERGALGRFRLRDRVASRRQKAAMADKPADRFP